MALAGFGSVFLALGKIYHEEFKEYLYKIAKNVNVHVFLNFFFEYLDRLSSLNKKPKQFTIFMLTLF